MSTSSGSIKRQQTLYVPQDIYINNNKAWHAGNLVKSEFAPSSHVGLGGAEHAAVTTLVNGFMTAADKIRLNAIQDNAINQTTADGRYLQLIGGTLSNSLIINNIGDAKLTLNADTDNDAAEGGEAKLVLTQDGGIVGVEIKTTQGGTADNTLTIAPFMDYNTASPVKNYSVFIHDQKIWHEGSLSKSEFAPASHVGTGGTSHAAVTTSTNGFMISTDKSKLDGIATSATLTAASSTNGSIKINGTDTVVYTHPTTAGSVHLPSGGATGQWVKWSAAGTGAWTAIDWSDIGSKPTSTVTNIDDAVSKRHTQNTDTGTTSSTFTISSGALATSGIKFGNVNQPYMKWNQTDGTFEFHKVADTTWGQVMASTFKKSDGTEVSYAGHTHDFSALTNIPATFTPPIATASTLGGVKVGSNVSVAADGTISVAAPYSHPTGDGNKHVPLDGGVNNNKVLKATSTAGSPAWGSVDFSELTGKPASYTPPIATASLLGGVKIGSNVSVGADGTISVAAPYSHPTGDGNKHVPADAGANSNKVLKATTTAGSPVWGSVDWSELINKPATFSPATHTHAISDVTNLSSTLNDKAGLSSANTFSYNGVAIKIQPSTAVANNAVLLQLNDSVGSSLVTMGTNASSAAKVVINGDLEVTGSTVQKSTQDIQGDMNVTGNLNVTGDAVLGDGAADQVTIKGDLRLEGDLLPIGRYLEVGRLPVFGIADDFQFETDSTTFQDIISHFSTFDTLGGSVFEAPNSGATRYYRLMVSYSSSGADDSLLRIVQEGNSTEVISFSLPSVNGVLDANSGLGNKARSWMSTHFSTTYTGSTTLQAKKNVSGNVAIRYIEIIAYDYYA